LEAGTAVREYRIEKMLGQGGMGEVYLAAHALTGQKVAMKVVSPELMRDEGVRRRFLEEARVMSGLKHPNIVQLLAFFEEGNRFFLVMEFIDGEDLDDRLGKGPLSVEQAVHIAGAMLAGLECGHTLAQPVVHRDIKPGNILLGKDGRVVITDFGVAKALGREKMTRAGGTVGTYEYMSPEQVRGEEVSPASDVYSVGITLYKMLTGVVPFPQKSESGIECMNGHLKEPVPGVGEYAEGLPHWVHGVLDKALAKESGSRFASAAAMAEALAAQSGPAGASPPTFEPAGGTSGRSKKGLIIGGALAAVVVCVLVALAVGLGSGKKEGDRPSSGGLHPAASGGLKFESAGGRKEGRTGGSLLSGIGFGKKGEEKKEGRKEEKKKEEPRYEKKKEEPKYEEKKEEPKYEEKKEEPKYEEKKEEPKYEEKKEEPRLVERVYPAFRITASDSSHDATVRTKRGPNVTYYASNVLDGVKETAWVEGVKGQGHGEWIRLDFDSYINVKELRIWTGYQKNVNDKLGDRYWINERPARVEVTTSDGSSSRVLADSKDMQRIPLSGEATNFVKLKLEAIYEAKYPDCAISEIQVIHLEAE